MGSGKFANVHEGSGNKHGSSKAKTKIEVSEVKEVSLQHKCLTVDSAHSRLCKLSSVTALDLSFNKMIGIPKGLPHCLVALNLSFNMIAAIEPVYRLNHLTELRLGHNQLSSCSGFSTAVSLEYLDLSFNKIKRVDGLENLLHMKQLNLEGNLIGGDTAVRSLYLNRSLTNVNLLHNGISNSQHFSLMILDLLPQLDVVNNERVKDTRRNRRSASNMSANRVTSSAAKTNCSKEQGDAVSYPCPAPSPVIDSLAATLNSECIERFQPAGVANVPNVASYAAQFEAQQDYIYASSTELGSFLSHQIVVPPYIDADVQAGIHTSRAVHAACGLRQPMHMPNLHVMALTHAEKVRKEQLESAEKKRWLLQLQLEEQEDEEAQEAANRSSLPWRKPPNPLPRGWDTKAKQLSTPRHTSQPNQHTSYRQNSPVKSNKKKQISHTNASANFSSICSENPMSPGEKKYYYQQVIDQNINQQSRDDINNESYRSHVPDNNGSGGLHSVDVSPYRKASFSDKKTTWMSPVLHKHRTTALHQNAVHEQNDNIKSHGLLGQRKRDKPEHLQNDTYHREESMATPFASGHIDRKDDGEVVGRGGHDVLMGYDQQDIHHSVGNVDKMTLADEHEYPTGFPLFNQFDRGNHNAADFSLDDSLWCTTALLEQISLSTDPIFATSNRNLYKEEGVDVGETKNKENNVASNSPDSAVAFGRRASGLGKANPGQRGSVSIPVTPTAASLRRFAFNQDKLMLEKEKILDDLSRRPENKPLRRGGGISKSQRSAVEPVEVSAEGEGIAAVRQQRYDVIPSAPLQVDVDVKVSLNTSLSSTSSHPLSNDYTPTLPPQSNPALAQQLSIEIPDRKFEELKSVADKFGKKNKIGAYSNANILGNPTQDILNFSVFSDATHSNNNSDVGTNSSAHMSQCLTPRTTTGPQTYSHYHSSAAEGNESSNDDFLAESDRHMAGLMNTSAVFDVDAQRDPVPHVSILSDALPNPLAIPSSTHSTHPVGASILDLKPPSTVSPKPVAAPTSRSHLLTESSRIAAALQSLLNRKKNFLDVMSQD